MYTDSRSQDKALDGSASDDELAAAAGADLMTDAPEILAWLQLTLRDLGAKPTVGMYTYLDSDAHVRVTLACDAIMSRLVPHAAAGSLAYIGTPSLVYDVPEQANEAAKAGEARGNVGRCSHVVTPVRALPWRAAAPTCSVRLCDGRLCHARCVCSQPTTGLGSAISGTRQTPVGPW